jgi:hypothetical protein
MKNFLQTCAWFIYFNMSPYFMGKIYPILVPFSIFPLKCMVKNNFKNVFRNTCCWWNKDYNYAMIFTVVFSFLKSVKRFKSYDNLKFGKWPLIFYNGCHFEFHIGTKNLKIVDDHPMNIHVQFGFNHICSF